MESEESGRRFLLVFIAKPQLSTERRKYLLHHRLVEFRIQLPVGLPAGAPAGAEPIGSPTASTPSGDRSSGSNGEIGSGGGGGGERAGSPCTRSKKSPE